MIGLPKYQATWAVFVIRILLDNFTREDDFHDFDIIDITLCHLAYSMVGKEYLAALYKLLDGQNVHEGYLNNKYPKIAATPSTTDSA